MAGRLELSHLSAIRAPGPANWSPDGRAVAYVQADRDGHATLRLLDLASGESRVLTEKPVVSEMTDGTDRRDVWGGPQWSPDGTRVAFVSRASGHAGTSIWTVDVRNGDLAEVTRHVGSDRTPRWSPDGRWIAFVGTRDGRDDIQVVPSVGGMAVQLTYDRWDNIDLSWSPDSARIAYISQRSDRDLFANSICVVDVQAGAIARLTDDDDANDRTPRWSPDGARIAFVSNRGIRTISGRSGRTVAICGGSRAAPAKKRIRSGRRTGGDCSIPARSAVGSRHGRWMWLAASRARSTSGYVNEAPRLSPDGHPSCRSMPVRESREIFASRRQDEPGGRSGSATDEGGRDTLLGMAFARPEVIQYTSLDGLEIEALLYTPENTGDKSAARRSSGCMAARMRCKPTAGTAPSSISRSAATRSWRRTIAGVRGTGRRSWRRTCRRRPAPTCRTGSPPPHSCAHCRVSTRRG